MSTDTPSNQPVAPNQLTAYFVVVSATDATAGPQQIIGWPALQYDEGSTAPAYTPPAGYRAYSLPDMTAETWDDLQHKQNGCGGGLAYEDGKIVPFSAPVYQPPLKEQAASALQQARTVVYNNYGSLNEPTPDAWVAYLRALMAINNGTDTTSTTLPTKPAQ